MKTQFLTTLVTGSLLLAACAKNDTPDAEHEVISFSGQISQLKATSNPSGASTVWSSGDQIGIFMVNQGTATISENSDNRQYNFNGTVFAPATGHEIYYPVSDSKVDFVAYYPFVATASLSTVLPIDVSQQNDLSKIDFLWSKATNGTTGFSKTTGTQVPFVFDHTLSKVVIKPTAGTGLDASNADWLAMDVKIKGMNTLSSIDLSTGTLGAASVPADINPFVKATGSTYEAIVLPTTYAAAGAVQFTFEVGSDTYVWSSQANEQFEPGKEYTYTITVSKTGVVLGNVTIEDWGTVSRTGTAD
ncbi:fimbrillin family protein [Sphingobacterium sp. LRF_L2]|uniref:fimbrillin family protein n=1 Tax=Sphingobacterium sp. LRF_L2 TaxID=3369421 RepID=UPI003F62E6FC